MVLSDVRERLLRRAAQELTEGLIVNLGIGLPTQIARYVPSSARVCIHSENGLAGMGPIASALSADRNLIDAGGAYVTAVAGASYFDSAVSFGLIRGGHLDLSILGAFEVASNGDLANWMIPGRFTPGVGGAIELAQKSRRVVVLTSHTDKVGRPKLVGRCTLPLTAAGRVSRVITDLAVIDVGSAGFILREIAQGVSVDDVVSATGAPLQVSETPRPTY